ncbi:MAG: phosphohydrolase, partial [Clostridiales bacterium]
IISIVEQHHGTSLMSFFYHKALEQAENPDMVSQVEFRYPGPKPQTKDAAIVLLADSVQAAVQSMVDPGKGQVEVKIREVIKGKVEDDQLQDCHLTFKDLESIVQAFTKVLIGMHHKRIVYPDEVAKEMGEISDDNRVEYSKSTKTDSNK